MNASFTLHPIAPYRLDYTVFTLRRRSKNSVDCWDGQNYTRVFNLDNKPIRVKVKQTNSLNNPELLVSLDEPLHPVVQEKIKHLIEMMLGLNRDLADFYKMAKDDARLSPLVFQFMGVKPPRFPSLFEALINAISCQQISLDAGLHIQNRLVQHVGIKMNYKNQVLNAFPTAEDVSYCSVAELRKIGYSTHKSETIIRLASTLKEEQFSFNCLEEKPNDEVIEWLCQFKGIGRWTAEYVLLRGLGRIEIFPSDDIGAQNNLQKLFHLEKKLDYKKTSEITALWYPYAGLVYFHLLLHKLDEKGAL
ncbi:DNA-3-methyladenine glycosylase 2 family protein [Legionella israelensis]|uniref:DNA-3-methyladenine glycosylase II n=1 Tax=Legionella israelensis TaxID=454 RepID=A0AAX1EJH8_9GAMM|nr:DNA-3-methyladenine glycosylase [Legionella israelensis]QBR85316.1 DNA-3-methyladenine glycosylase 2 family protein [Legionella israelensis]